MRSIVMPIRKTETGSLYTITIRGTTNIGIAKTVRKTEIGTLLLPEA